MAKPLVSDELWALVEPLLPPEPPKPKGGRPRIPDRAALTGIVFVLRSGIPWEMLPAEMGCGSGMTCWRRLRDWQQVRVSELVQRLPADGWVRLSAGAGAKGLRLYDWQLVSLHAPLVEGWRRWLLVRRNLDDATETATFVCCAPAATPLATLVRIAGSRWRIESAFQEAKSEVGLDHYEVRSYGGWYRHVTLACLAHALLTVLRLHAVDVAAAPDAAEKGGAAAGSLAAFKRRRGLVSA